MACGACQFLRRKCAQSCIFAPYFSSKETGSDQYRAIHSVFGTSHFAKLLLEVPEDQRHVAASTILFEAERRLRYPVHGCYTNIYALREEIKNLNEELAAAYGELAACGGLDGATINTGQYVNNHIPEHVHLDEQQSIPSQNCAVNNVHAESTMMDEGSNYSAVRLPAQQSMSRDKSNLNTTSGQQNLPSQHSMSRDMNNLNTTSGQQNLPSQQTMRNYMSSINATSGKQKFVMERISLGPSGQQNLPSQQTKRNYMSSINATSGKQKFVMERISLGQLARNGER